MQIANNVTGDLVKSELLYFEKKYYELVTEKEFLENFELTNIDEYLFIPSLDFFHLGEKNYILQVKSDLKYIEKEFILNIIDDIPPSIYGPEKVYINTPFNVDNILNYYVAKDDFEGIVKVKISDFDQEKLANEKECNIELYAEDNTKNIAYKKVKAYLSNKDYSLFYKDNIEISIDKSTLITAANIIDILIKNDCLEHITQFEIVSFDIDNINSNRIGKYPCKIVIRYENNDYEIDIMINIIEIQNNKESLIDKIINFIKEVLQKWGCFYEK